MASWNTEHILESGAGSSSEAILDELVYPLDTTNECTVFVQDGIASAFPLMEEIRRQGKLCDVVLKITSTKCTWHPAIC